MEGCEISKHHDIQHLYLEMRKRISFYQAEALDFLTQGFVGRSELCVKINSFFECTFLAEIVQEFRNCKAKR